MYKHYFIIILVVVGIQFASAQDQYGPTSIGTLVKVGEKKPVNSRTTLPGPRTKVQVMKDGRSKVRKTKFNVVPGKGLEKDALSKNPHPLQGKVPSRMPSLVFDAVSSGSQPTDPSLAIGPNDVVVVFNTGIVFYDKTGTIRSGPVGPGAIFADSDVCCDLTVSYDNVADRWVLTVLSATAAGNATSKLQIAVSDGPDPVTSNWVTYEIVENSDYQKLSVYGNGYYMTNNGTTDVFALERDAMLAGEPSASIQGFTIPGISTFGFASPQFLNVSNDDVPEPGTAPLVFFQDNAYQGVDEDHVKFWNLSADFENPANSTISAPQEIPVTPFNSIFDGGRFDNLTQPNGGFELDALQGIIMNQAQFRKFSTHNSAVFNHVIDAGFSGELAAIRWYEFRQPEDGAPWTLYQEGTYRAPNNKHAWNASLIMDNKGNIGMGYTGMGGTNDVDVSSYFTGRLATDDLGVMTLSETPIAIGDGPIPGGTSNTGTRYGDYSKIDVDPNDDQTFWFINEYHGVNTPINQRSNVVGRFKIAPDTNTDTGVVAILQPEDGDLSASETVQVAIRNFGLVAQNNIPVSYSIDGGATISEVFSGAIAAGETEVYTFTQTANLGQEGQTYSISSSTSLSGDETPENDDVTRNVIHLNDLDVGVAAITSPVENEPLTADQQIRVRLKNFGVSTQTNIPVFYRINNGALVQETYTGSIVSGETDDYVFSTTADLSEEGSYTILAGTDLANDAIADNDTATLTVVNEICEPTSNCETFNDGITQLTLAGQTVNTTCSNDGYSDNTSTVFNFSVSDNNPFNGTLQMGFSDSVYAIWIDFNDNNFFEPNELMASGSVTMADTDEAFTIDFSTVENVTDGMFRMRIRGEDEDEPGNVLDPCGDLAFGRTNDYTANISNSLGVDDNNFSNGELVVYSEDNTLFEVSFNTTNSFELLPVTIYDMQGKTLAYYTVENHGSGFTKTVDMSYVSAGIYFVKVGDEVSNLVQRIIVK